LASGSCGCVQSSFESFFFRFRSIRARSARVGGRLDARGLRQLRQEVLIARARVAPHEAAQRRVGFQRRRIDADRRAVDQARIGQSLQHPGEDGFVRLQIDQAPCPGNRRMVGRRRGQHQAEKLAQRKRIRCPPGDRALSVQPFEVADQQQTKVAAGWQTGPPFVRIQSPAQPLDEPVEVVRVEDLIQPLVERMRGTARQVWVATHIEACFACRFRLPSPSATVSYAGSIESIPNLPFHHGLLVPWIGDF
jgi:hypothetical protein